MPGRKGRCGDADGGPRRRDHSTGRSDPLACLAGVVCRVRPGSACGLSEHDPPRSTNLRHGLRGAAVGARSGVRSGWRRSVGSVGGLALACGDRKLGGSGRARRSGCQARDCSRPGGRQEWRSSDAHASQPQHVHLGDGGNRLGGCCCERKQRRSRPLVPGRAAVENNWLIDDVAAPEVADRHDQGCATTAVASVQLGGIRPSAAVPPFGMCPEPSPIKPGNFVQTPRHRDRGPSPDEEVVAGAKMKPATRIVRWE
jgi:hypothetical protein